jgi:transcriptional regulator with XRE-family HTH domain
MKIYPNLDIIKLWVIGNIRLVAKPTVNYFAQNLRYIRRRFDITQSELALRMETGQSTIANWENGVSLPNVENLSLFYQILGIDIHTMIIIDMENGKVLGDEEVKEFKRSGKVSGKLSGKVTGYKRTKYIPSNAPLSMFNEADETTTWVITKLLKTMHSDIEKINKTVEDINKKVSK